MCEFISWIEHNGKNWFLTKNELSTPRGKELIGYCGDTTDLTGHGAIKWYYKFKGGFDKECTDFTDPRRFPPEIVVALKDELFEGVGVAPETLTKIARNKFDTTEQRAIEEYYEIEQRAIEEYRRTWKECCKIRQQPWKKYEEAIRQARKKYNKKVQQTFWKLFKDPNNRAEAWR